MKSLFIHLNENAIENTFHLHQPRQIHYNVIMATFNTVEELFRILDDDPQLLEALRARLLTRELLALPAAHAAFVAEMHAFVAETREFVAVSNRRFESIEYKLENLDRRVIRLGNDFGLFRGSYAENTARKSVDTIAIRVGNARGIDLDEFTIQTLDSDALKDKARAFPDISDIPQGERLSFYESDLIAEVQDLEGETYYIVVEASYTCDETDTDRAISHAKLLTRFTRKKAYAVVAGFRIDSEIRETIEAGDVFWYEIDDSDLKP